MESHVYDVSTFLGWEDERAFILTTLIQSIILKIK